jgi:co-chaperonin GroES (HSP10)
MKVRAAPGKLLIRRLKEDEMTKGGLVLTDRKELPYGEVIDMGKCRTPSDHEVAQLICIPIPGETDVWTKTVIFQVVAATKIDIMGEETYYMIEYEDVIGVIEEAEETPCK